MLRKLVFDASRLFPPAVEKSRRIQGKNLVQSLREPFSKEEWRQEVVIKSRVGYEQLHALSTQHRSHDPLPLSLMFAKTTELQMLRRNRQELFDFSSGT